MCIDQQKLNRRKSERQMSTKFGRRQADKQMIPHLQKRKGWYPQDHSREPRKHTWKGSGIWATANSGWKSLKEEIGLPKA